MTDAHDAYQENVNAIRDYLLEGIKPKTRGIGIELEHTLVHSDGRPVSFDEEHGQRWLLGKLKPYYKEAQIGEDGSVIGLLGESSSVTLEPAAQVELSAGPFSDLREARRKFMDFQEKLDELMSPWDIEVLTPGYHTTAKAFELGIIPKERYSVMNEYLGAISMYGICMMRGSASTQVAIDFRSEEDCMRKLRLANACVPLLSLMCDNSPIFEGNVREHQLVRTEIWNKTDPNRCGIIPGSMEKDFDFEKYAEYILNAPIMVDYSDGHPVYSDKLIRDVYSARKMRKEDVEHVLTVFFNDVRLKRYVEIRPADAMPIEYVIAYAALIFGLFYSDSSLDALEGIFGGVTEQDITRAKDSLMQDGYNGYVYGSPVSEIVDELIGIALSASTDADSDLMAPLVSLASQRVTLADIALRGY